MSIKVRRVSDNTTINEGYWAEKTQKQFVNYFSGRVNSSDLDNHYNEFGKKKSNKKVKEEEPEDTEK